MNPFRKSREFALYRQLVFGARADAPQRDDLEFAAYERAEPQAAQTHGNAQDDDAFADSGKETA